jgi:antitoxin CcdA
MKAKLNLSISQEVTREARALGINMSEVAEAAIAQASKAERNRRWAAANRDALDAYGAEVARDGLPLAKHRTF